MEVKHVMALAAEIGDTFQKLEEARRNLVGLSGAVVNKNPEMVEFYYHRFEVTQRDYDKTCKNFLHQIQRLAVAQRHTTQDKEVGR